MTLVNWPGWDPDFGYRDSGEGGLFAYAVWDLPAETDCVVDTHPALGLGDVRVAAHGPLRPDFEEQDVRNRSADWGTAESYSAHEHHVEASFGTVVFLGSTGGSFFSEHRGEYFSVTAEDLTETGTTLVATLSTVYGSEPTFVTYLDT